MQRPNNSSEIYNQLQQQQKLHQMMGGSVPNKMFRSNGGQMYHLQPHQQQVQQQSNSSMEQVWLKVGNLAVNMEEWDKAIIAFESAIKYNPASITGYYCLASSLHQQLQFVQAIEVYHRLLGLLQSIPVQDGSAGSSTSGISTLKGEIWASIGHCALLLDNLAKAFSAFQQALQILGSPKDASIWFAIGLLYDRYGADELAREAFLITLRYEQQEQQEQQTDNVIPSLRQREIYYRLGLIYLNLKKWDLSMECFQFCLDLPPAGLGRDDVYFYIGVLHGIQGDFESGKEIFQYIGGDLVNDTIVPPKHEVFASKTIQLKSRQIVGWYESLCNCPERVPVGLAVAQAAVDEDPSEGFGWYCIGRINMLTKDFSKAYEAYQQAVYRDGANASFWNSIGILYYEIGQFRDALDAYSRSIHLAPFVADTWWNLGVLYENSHKQYEDALDAYNRAAELDPNCTRIAERLALLRAGQATHQLPKQEDESSAPRPFEYCPMPFFSRPVILGGASIPPQRPALGIQPPNQAIPVVEKPAPASAAISLPANTILQQSRQQAQHPLSLSNRSNSGTSSNSNSSAPFSLPQPNTNYYQTHGLQLHNAALPAVSSQQQQQQQMLHHLRQGRH